MDHQVLTTLKAPRVNPPPRTCIYCGGPVRKIRRGEHVIPEAIGGTRCIKVVCTECNNALSDVDRELCSRSPLALIACREIASHLAECWDVDHAQGNLLLEAAPSRDGPPSVLPQLILDGGGPQLWAPADAMAAVGARHFEAAFFKLMVRAFDGYRAGRRGSMLFHRTPARAIPEDYRLPPRVFTRCTAAELIERAHNRAAFEVRFSSDEDRRHVIRTLSHWKTDARARSFAVRPGSTGPIDGSAFEIGKAARGLLKIALNLVVHMTRATQVDARAFGDVIDVIAGRQALSNAALSGIGFVRPAGLEPIHPPASSHSIRLVHDSGQWRAYMAFFGGKVCAVVRFPGPSAESWKTLDVVAPIRSPEWTIKESPILQLLRPIVVWNDVQQIVPSLQLRTLSSVLIPKHPRGGSRAPG